MPASFQPLTTTSRPEKLVSSLETLRNHDEDNDGDVSTARRIIPVVMRVATRIKTYDTASDDVC